MHVTSVSMDLKQICLRLQLYFPFERKKSDVPQFSISMVAVPSRASQTKRLNSTSTDDNLPRFRGTQRESFSKILEKSFSAFLDCFRAF